MSHGSLLYSATEAHRHGRSSLRIALNWTKKCYCTPLHHGRADMFASTYPVCTKRTKWQIRHDGAVGVAIFRTKSKVEKKKLHYLCLRIFSSKHPAFTGSQWFIRLKTEHNLLSCRIDTSLVVDGLHTHTCNAKIVVLVCDLWCNRTVKGVPVTRYT